MQLAQAHQKDLEVQARHGVQFLNYWYSEAEGTVFCLSDAPNKEAPAAAHRQAYGNVPDQVMEVKQGIH